MNTPESIRYFDILTEYVIDVKGIHYEEEVAPEAVEYMFLSGQSIIITTATDWSLSVESGSWPDLPAWCYPSESWSFRPMRSELGACRQIHLQRDSGGALKGVILTFRSASVVIGSGEHITIDFVESQ